MAKLLLFVGSSSFIMVGCGWLWEVFAKLWLVVGGHGLSWVVAQFDTVVDKAINEFQIEMKGLVFVEKPINSSNLSLTVGTLYACMYLFAIIKKC